VGPGWLLRRSLIGLSALVTVAVVAIVLLAGHSSTTSGHGLSSAGSKPATTAGSTPATTAGSTPVITGSRPAPIVYRPPGLSFAHKVALVIGLYGAEGCPQCMEGLSKFEQVATEHGFVVAYPGSTTSPPWNSSGDMTYLSSFISTVVAQQNIDPQRVYVTGFSAGGRMAYQVGCALSKQVAAIAIVSSVMRQYPCPLAHPISELTIDGSTETTAVDGSANGIPPATSTAAKWRTLDGCSSQTAPQTSTVGPVTQQTWGSCVDGSAVALYLLAGGHHTWPGSSGLRPSDPDAQYNASEAIWAFFAAHPGASVTRPTAGLLQLSAASKQRIVTVLRLGESVSIRETLVQGGRRLASKNGFLLAGAQVSLVLVIPPRFGRGRASVRLVIHDAYGRVLQLARGIYLRYAIKH
jgi:polyhydroxybutyrate depolymerase